MGGIVKILEEHKHSIKRKSKTLTEMDEDCIAQNAAKKKRSETYTSPTTNGTTYSTSYQSHTPTTAPCRNGTSTPTVPHQPHSNGSAPNPNPFAGLSLPYGRNSRANAGYILEQLIGSYLVTHPHLDHMSAFIINSQNFPLPNKARNEEPKIVAGHECVITILKDHVFNDIVWPNLSNEGGGPGLFQYERLIPTKTNENLDVAKFDRHVTTLPKTNLTIESFEVTHGKCFSGHGGKEHPIHTPNPSAKYRRVSNAMAAEGQHHHPVESSVFFISDASSPKPAEVMIWGDVEADSISSFPRNAPVWALAAKKVVHAGLRAILIECSYDSKRPKELLFGHLNTSYLLEELEVLGRNIVRERLNLLQNSGVMSPSTQEAVSQNFTAGRKRKREQVGLSLNDLEQFSFKTDCRSSQFQSIPAAISANGELLQNPTAYYDHPVTSPATILPTNCTSVAGASVDSYFPLHSPTGPTTVSSSRRSSGVPGIEITNDKGLLTPAQTRVGTFAESDIVTTPELDLERAMLRHPELENPLQGVTVVVTHVKETWANMNDNDEEEEPEGDKERILRELIEMGAERKFVAGVKWVMARRGTEIWV